MPVKPAFPGAARPYPFLAYNAIEDRWERVSDRAWRMNEEQYEEGQTDQAVDKLRESMQIQSRKAYMKRDRREALISRALTFAIALVVIGLVLIALGGLR